MATSAMTDPVPGVSPEIYSTADFTAVSRIVHEAVGIVLPQGKGMLVYSRLAPLVRAAGAVTFSRYIEMMRANGEEMGRAVAALTTNHTFFYREAHHFEHLQGEVRPRLVEKLHQRDPVRLWSAGCSSGEETWSIVMTLLGPDRAAGIDLARRDLRVLASDIAPHALQKAAGATYAAKDLKPVPQDLRRLWTAEQHGHVTLAEPPRSIVRFRALNLLGEWPIRGRFDVIFCRNVMIYFDAATNERLVRRFAEALLPGGHLYIGHSERVTGSAADLLELVGPTIYRRRGA